MLDGRRGRSPRTRALKSRDHGARADPGAGVRRRRARGTSTSRPTRTASTAGSPTGDPRGRSARAVVRPRAARASTSAGRRERDHHAGGPGGSLHPDRRSRAAGRRRRTALARLPRSARAPSRRWRGRRPGGPRARRSARRSHRAGRLHGDGLRRGADAVRGRRAGRRAAGDGARQRAAAARAPPAVVARAARGRGGARCWGSSSEPALRWLPGRAGAAVAAAVLALGYLVATQGLFTGSGLALGGIYAAGRRSSLATLGGAVYRSVVEEGEKRKVRDAFQHYVNPEIAELIARSRPGCGWAASGARSPCCSRDIRGFTGMAERLPPETLGELLNQYLGSHDRHGVHARRPARQVHRRRRHGLLGRAGGCAGPRGPVLPRRARHAGRRSSG